MNILFRTAGGNTKQHELGTGHVFRCINLAKIFNKEKISFLVEDYGGLKKIFKENNFSDIEFLKKCTTEKYELNRIEKIISEKKIDLVIIDKISTKKSFLKKIKSIIPTVYISDLKNYDYPVDLVINGFIGLSNRKIRNKYNAISLLGPKYQILNKNKIKTQKKKYDLLISLGGFDRNNILEQLSKILPKYLNQLKIRIILGPTTKKRKSITILEKNFENNISVIKYSKNLQEEIAKSKFGLCAGGITTYEFARLNVSFFIICQYEHQQLTAKYWKKFGYCHDYVKPNANLKKIDRYLRYITNDRIIVKRKKIKIDNLGASRIRKEIQNLKIT